MELMCAVILDNRSGCPPCRNPFPREDNRTQPPNHACFTQLDPRAHALANWCTKEKQSYWLSSAPLCQAHKEWSDSAPCIATKRLSSDPQTDRPELVSMLRLRFTQMNGRGRDPFFIWANHYESLRSWQSGWMHHSGSSPTGTEKQASYCWPCGAALEFKKYSQPTGAVQEWRSVSLVPAGCVCLACLDTPSRLRPISRGCELSDRTITQDGRDIPGAYSRPARFALSFSHRLPSRGAALSVRRKLLKTLCVCRPVLRGRPESCLGRMTRFALVSALS